MFTKLSNHLYHLWVHDNKIDLFEGQYLVPDGISYNSYIIMDEKIAIIDTVDQHFGQKWIHDVEEILHQNKPTYLIIQHVEPDHSGSINLFLEKYPSITVVATKMAFNFIEQFYHCSILNKIEIKQDNMQLSLGKNTLNFILAPFVHWPEVMVTYNQNDLTLFSADGFSKFGSFDIHQQWVEEARRYYIGIVGKYGKNVQQLISKAGQLQIKQICPLHGPVLKKNINYYLNLYHIWSSYQNEDQGIAIFYTSMYGNTKKAIQYFYEQLKNKTKKNIEIYDLARSDFHQCIAKAFQYQNIILATPTYNNGIFPIMKHFLDQLVDRNWQNKKIAIVENGTWNPLAIKTIKTILKPCQNIAYFDNLITIHSSMNDKNKQELNTLIKELFN